MAVAGKDKSGALELVQVKIVLRSWRAPERPAPGSLRNAARHETQPETLPARLITAFTFAERLNFLWSCRFRLGVTSNFAEYYIEPLCGKSGAAG